MRRRGKEEGERKEGERNLKGSGLGISTMSSTSNNRGIPCRTEKGWRMSERKREKRRGKIRRNKRPQAKHISKMSAGDFVETELKGISFG